MKMQTSKGFTIIELLVVVAIIAVLTGIVLVNVTSYINKSKNAAIQGNLSTLLTNGAVYFDQNPSNTGAQFAADGGTGVGTAKSLGCQGTVKTAISNAGGSLACVGDSGSQAWCGTSATLAYGSTGASTFCVDYTGYKGVLGASKCTGAVYTCQ